MIDPMTPEELQVCRERAEAAGATPGSRIARLLATSDAAQGEIAVLRWGVVANTINSASYAPRWVHVQRVTGFGSTAARKLCRDAGFDPDESVGNQRPSAPPTPTAHVPDGETGPGPSQ